MHNVLAQIQEITRQDPRYEREAYLFVREAIDFTRKNLERDDKEPHVTGQELLDGIRELGLKEFGPLAQTVFGQWGVHRTDDFGNVVFNMIEAGIMRKQPDDRQDHFHDVYDFDLALRFEIDLDELELDWPVIGPFPTPIEG